ncbi:hypothetical protein OG226_41565 [Streptomyces sp. NBC_01261]|uniref:hypothetical protein n=1 Tax=Streptomyces sp. NBC_01261 TaxID=2903802 RepID=UPI002E309083|nr:hypothetical protein [Streptomyces sp. NBC_01261]
MEEQAATEERGTYSQETHELFREAGFYRTFLPRRFGGYEFGLPTFVRTIMEIARGCPSSAWCLALASGHALQLGSWFSESAQIEALSPNGDFGAPLRGIPHGTAERVDDGWRIEGTWDYCSGSSYASHAMLMVRMVDGSDGLPQIKLALVPRADWTSLGDWRGRAFGMGGSGSDSIRVDGAVIPDHFVVDAQIAFTSEVETLGYQLHGNPLYTAKAFVVWPLEITAVLVGTARAALDEHERLLRTKMAFATPLPGSPPGPPAPLHTDQDQQRWFGLASGRVAAAESLLVALSEQVMRDCQEVTDGVKKYTFAEGIEFGLARQQALNLGWEAVDLLYQASSTSEGGRKGSRMNRYYRDYSITRTNLLVNEDKMAAMYSQQYFAANP